MTDELELLKKDWQKKEFNIPQLSYEDIHKMIWKKSSSVVKWILIISVLEFVLPQLLYLLPGMQETLSVYEHMGVSQFFIGISIFYYGVVLYFIYQFYLRFREISVLDNSKNLMRKIIKTRKTVKHYVIFSLGIAVLSFITMILGIYMHQDIISVFPEMSDRLKGIAPEKFKMSLMIAIGVIGILFVLLLGLFYFLVYGLLLRKLKKNYGELRQLQF